MMSPQTPQDLTESQRRFIAQRQAESAFRQSAQQKKADDPFNGVQAANEAVKKANAEGSALIFITRSHYQDLIYRANLPELTSYKGKLIMVVSDPAPEFAPLC